MDRRHGKESQYRRTDSPRDSESPRPERQRNYPTSSYAPFSSGGYGQQATASSYPVHSSTGYGQQATASSSGYYDPVRGVGRQEQGRQQDPGYRPQRYDAIRNTLSVDESRYDPRRDAYVPPATSAPTSGPTQASYTMPAWRAAGPRSSTSSRAHASGGPPQSYQSTIGPPTSSAGQQPSYPPAIFPSQPTSTASIPVTFLPSRPPASAGSRERDRGAPPHSSSRLNKAHRLQNIDERAGTFGTLSFDSGPRSSRTPTSTARPSQPVPPGRNPPVESGYSRFATATTTSGGHSLGHRATTSGGRSSGHHATASSAEQDLYGHSSRRRHRSEDSDHDDLYRDPSPPRRRRG
ncbi:hypothetical protein BDV96DRAFT_635442 [Lophiotrema nucula]|uniref:Uncharacterized protein n=1 Tax=Lophiotrema nucula TaxID=690887 RepID=A0A6A5YTQ0_9PLEO|nr:hypothetical protein BDV96DRAFT_635442 [Lophiotrema nucula]